MGRLAIMRLLVFAAFILSPAAAGSDQILTGAGATFPHPLYQKWFDLYQQRDGVRVTYQAVGSGGGIRKLLERSVDFGATDAFLSNEELANAPARILHLPTCVGAVAITYNVPGGPELKFTPDLLAAVFLGRLTSWQDPRIASVNPGVKLPALEMTVVHRSEESGTTFLFTDYLSKVSRDWEERVGRGRKVRWPCGIGVEGNPGVADFVKKIPGAVGYVELSYAQAQGLPAGIIMNRAGGFIRPTLQSVTAAATLELPADTRILITDTSAADGYPVSAFTYLIFYQEQSYDNRSEERARTLARFLWWIIHEGQAHNQSLLYAPLSGPAVEGAERILHTMTYRGRPLIAP